MPWIRPMYLHPAHVNDRLVERWARARVVPYLDMPVQHGDDGVLRAMRRAITAKRMREIVRAFRDAIPGLAVRTTVLVGFPGESETAFQNLLEFLEDARFDRLGVFTYSPEEGTPSVAYPDQVAARDRRGARRDRPGASRSPRVGAERRARRHGDGRPDRRPERGPRVRVGGTHGRSGARDRRRRVPARSWSEARTVRPHPHRRGRGIRAGRRARLASPRRSTA